MEVGKRVTISGTNSIWDGKEGTVEAINEEDGTCTVFVDFKPQEGKKVRQNFSLSAIGESLEEALKDKSSGKTGELIKDYKNGYVVKNAENKFVGINDVEDDAIILDIGPETSKMFVSRICGFAPHQYSHSLYRLCQSSELSSALGFGLPHTSSIILFNR